MDIVVWLRSLGLGQYEAVFRQAKKKPRASAAKWGLTMKSKHAHAAIRPD